MHQSAVTERSLRSRQEVSQRRTEAFAENEVNEPLSPEAVGLLDHVGEQLAQETSTQLNLGLAPVTQGYHVPPKTKPNKRKKTTSANAPDNEGSRPCKQTLDTKLDRVIELLQDIKRSMDVLRTNQQAISGRLKMVEDRTSLVSIQHTTAVPSGGSKQQPAGFIKLSAAQVFEDGRPVRMGDTLVDTSRMQVGYYHKLWTSNTLMK